MHHLCVAALLSVVALTSSALAAPERTVTLDELLAVALASSPAAQELNLKQAESIAEALSVSLKPNPELLSEVRSRVGGTRGDVEYEIGMAQQVRPGDFGLRTRVRQLLEEAAHSDRGIAVVELSQKVKLLYCALWTSYQQGIFLEYAKKHAQDVAKTVQRGVSQGILTTSEAKLFSAEAKRLEAELIGARGEQRRSEAELLHISGFPTPLPIPLKPIFAPFPSEREILTLLQQGTFPVQRRAVLAGHVSQVRAELARKGAWPAIVPSLAFEHTSEGEDRVNVGFSVNLPFFDRNQPDRIKFEAQRKLSQEQERFLLDGRFAHEVVLRFQSASDLFAQHQAYESEAIPLLKTALDTLESQYQAGQGSVLLIWQAQRELLETRQRALELWLKAITARLELETLIGKEF